MPVLPWEVSLRNAGWFLEASEAGGMVLKLVPLQPLPDGSQVPVGMAVEVAFSADGWERFRRDVAAGERSQIVVAPVLPRSNGAMH